jgi:hypothetical protein
MSVKNIFKFFTAPAEAYQALIVYSAIAAAGGFALNFEIAKEVASFLGAGLLAGAFVSWIFQFENERSDSKKVKAAFEGVDLEFIKNMPKRDGFFVLNAQSIASGILSDREKFALSIVKTEKGRGLAEITKSKMKRNIFTKIEQVYASNEPIQSAWMLL